MPTTATIGGTSSTTSSNSANSASSAQAATVPFIRASAEHREPLGLDITRQFTASDQDLSVFDVPAYGYVRAIVLLVQATGGTGTSVTAAEDGPFNAIKNIALTEPNGAQIAQFNSGYDLFLANKYGGYKAGDYADPRNSPIYSSVAAGTGNFQFLLRIPLELSQRDGLGSLPNQNAAATFKLRLSLAASTTVFGTVPTTLPNVRIRAYLEAWDQPEASTGGAVNATQPPAMNTTQFWTSQVINYSAGQQTLRLTRVGNYIRNLILVARRGGTSRLNGDADFPDPTSIQLDTRPLDIVEHNSWKHQMFERGGYGSRGSANETLGGLDNGVYVYDFDHEFDGMYGRENRDLWLPTLSSTRLELQGTFANAGTLTVLTNDVSVAGNVFM